MSPVRSASVSVQIWARNDLYPLGLPSVNGEFANIAVATGCSARPIRILRTMSASEAKSRFTWIVDVLYIMSRPSDPTFGM